MIQSATKMALEDRLILVDWLSQVQIQFSYNKQSLHKAIFYFDLVTSKRGFLREGL